MNWKHFRLVGIFPLPGCLRLAAADLGDLVVIGLHCLHCVRSFEYPPMVLGGCDCQQLSRFVRKPNA